ncbi:MAG: hypothetical protein ACOC0R_02110 [Mariniphaga sp.]
MKVTKFKFLYVLFILAVLPGNASAQKLWDSSGYPDETGFQERISPMLKRIAALDFGKRSQATSRCPDTGLPVKAWAVEGEKVISPYTGRKYIQGPTGYFGPKARNAQGEIIAFSGDPLKYDLPPATAALLINQETERAKAFLSIPGNLRQQYHFACKNWARFYPLLADEMGDDWKNKFYQWVGSYSESRRPSDGGNEWLNLSKDHNLVGEPGEILGGNTIDGGTENHKTMWRTSALLYAQLFPDTARISGYNTGEAEKLTKKMLVEYMKRILHTGNGEYDSQVYYPHSIEGFLNLYDFSPDPQTRLLAKCLLDYYFATYGLKVIDGTIAGAQKRGYLAQEKLSEMEIMQWAFFNSTSRDMSNAHTQIQQTTTTYRPNKIIHDITTKNIALPFEARMSRPFYHMDHPHAFAETFYCSHSFAMGNIQMTIVDNPNQQMVWSLVTKGTHGPLCFSGGHPMRRSTSGHSPYTQTMQSKGTLMLITAPTKLIPDADTLIAPLHSKIVRANLWHLPSGEQGKDFELKNRQKYGRKNLKAVTPLQGSSAKDYEDFWNNNQGSACSWFYYPFQLNPVKKEGIWLIEANELFVAVIPLTETSQNIAPPNNLVNEMKGSAANFFNNYHLLHFPGEVSGYIVETGEKSDYQSLEDFHTSLVRKMEIDKTQLSNNRKISYRTLTGDQLVMQYIPEMLRCKAVINGKDINWDNLTNGAVYESPFLKVKDGRMEISNGKEGYAVEIKNDNPVWEMIIK